MATSTLPSPTLWKLVDEKTGVGQNITLPSSWDEIWVVSTAVGYGFTFNVPYLYAASNSGSIKKLLQGYANQGASSYWSCEINLTPTQVASIAFSYNGAAQTPKTTVYYR